MHIVLITFCLNPPSKRVNSLIMFFMRVLVRRETEKQQASRFKVNFMTSHIKHCKTAISGMSCDLIPGPRSAINKAIFPSSELQAFKIDLEWC